MGVRDELMEHVPRLRRYARALITNRDLADDLVQDTSSARCATRRCSKRVRTCERWLFTIMHNVHVNQVRTASGRAVHVSVDDDEFAERQFAVHGDHWKALEARSRLCAAASGPSSSAEVVLLVGLEEMSYSKWRLRSTSPSAR